MADNVTIKAFINKGNISKSPSNNIKPNINVPNYFNKTNNTVSGFDDRGFKLNDSSYSTEGSLTERGYPSSISDSANSTLVITKTNLTPQEMPKTASTTEPILEPVLTAEDKTPNISYENIDFSKISATANDAINNKYVNVKDSAKQYWQGDLTYQERDDGSIKVMSSDGTPLGFITKNSLLDGGINEATITSDETEQIPNLTLGEQTMANQSDNLEKIDEEVQIDKVNPDVSMFDSGGTLLMPFPTEADKIYITSEFGDRDAPVDGASTDHKGIDIVATSEDGKNIPVLSLGDGTVVVSKVNSGGINSGYGNYIVVEYNINGKTMSVLYAHLKDRKYNVGDEVHLGDDLGNMGSTGNVNGAHLHLEMCEGTWSPDCERINPLKYIVDDVNKYPVDDKGHIYLKGLPEESNEAVEKENDTIDDAQISDDNSKINYTQTENTTSKQADEVSTNYTVPAESANISQIQFGSNNSGMPQFGENGLLIMADDSQKCQDVVNMIYHDVPRDLVDGAHKNGTHSLELDNMIDNLSTEECLRVLNKLEGDNYGQPRFNAKEGITTEICEALINEQIIKRYDGDIHNLLKKWGTYSYGGY